MHFLSFAWKDRGIFIDADLRLRSGFILEQYSAAFVSVLPALPSANRTISYSSLDPLHYITTLQSHARKIIHCEP
jgi:hypothetical protein